ncbi:SAM-dependent methyltransferase [Spirochaeta cellobiosiphila]|uniref:SAM-dependent methyltransferase n=1 Tax=Spirochaeta cellobiosiphila TaxID=504483 RepID=UPI00041DA044|nr:RlmE family RNA methyltransferase [Spirochaeta cellobiosiphila]
MAKRDTLDFYSLKAQKEGYPARSVYKLEEIQQKIKVIKPKDHVLDIGASPGSWSLYVLKILKGQGKLTAIDLKPLNLKKQPPSNYDFFQGDVFDKENQDILREKGPYHVIISDAAPSTTGNRTIDCGRSYSLNEQILSVGDALLETGGNLIIKVFQGGDEKILLERMQQSFDKVKILKPKAVRKISFETYFIGLGKKANNPELTEDEPSS